MNKFIITLLALIAFSTHQAQAHCEIPCGIFDDAARFNTIIEHAKTIEKSMKEINRLSKENKPDYHMISRWTTNKEKHAQEVQDIASVYFLAQRVKKPETETEKEIYIKHLTLLHEIIITAMRTKQTTDLDYVEKLRDLTQEYKKHYFSKHGHTH